MRFSTLHDGKLKTFLKNYQIRWFILIVVMTIGISPLFADISNPKAPDTKAQSASQGGIAPAGSADNFLFTGSFLYNIPIDVPPGVAGMQPQIALQYNSSQQNGIIGAGWDLSLGSIQRSLKNGVPTYTSSDIYTFTLNGETQELAPTGTDSNGNLVFHSKIEEAFLKFVQSVDGTHWTVYDKSGTQYFFGETAASRIAGTPGIFWWALDNVVDRNGNTMTFSYLADQSQLYPQDIVYASNRKVHFSYQTRPDPISNNRAKLAQVMAQRLSAIDTYVNQNSAWTNVKTYTMNYGIPALRVQSELQSVQVTGDGAAPITLPVGTMNYNTPASGWTSASVPGLPYPSIILNDGVGLQSIDDGVRFVDLNGDGRLDILVARHETNASGQVFERRFAYLNTATGWQDVSATWNPPLAFTDLYYGESSVQNFSTDDGVRILDINGDGLPDIVQSQQITSVIDKFGHTTTVWNKNVWLNNGAGWTLNNSSNWKVPVAISSENFSLGGVTPTILDTGVEVVDLNGDGLPDFIQAVPGSMHAWINNGSGWTQNDTWAPPVYFSNGVFELGVRLVDLNGDGLPDLINSFHDETKTDTNLIYLNTGSGWALSNWKAPASLEAHGNTGNRDRGVQFVDVNGDGLLDWVESTQGEPGNGTGVVSHVYLNTGSGWSDASSQYSFPIPFMVVNGGDEFNTFTTGALFLDMNGDGQPDLVESNIHNNVTTSSVWLSNAQPELIQAIHNPLGGEVDLQYTCSLQLSGTHQIPYPIQVLTQMKNQDGKGGTVTSSYSYDQGFFDPVQKEFLGFGKVKTSDASGSFSQTYYLQNKDADGNAAPINCYKGRVSKVEGYDAGGNLLTSEQTRWDKSQPFSGSTVYFVRPTWTKNTLFDVSPNLITETDLFYNEAVGSPTYGNILKTIDQGDTAITGDEKTDIIEYAVNATNNLLNFPQRTATYGPDGTTKLSETLFYYDGTSNSPLAYGTLSKGNVTQVQRWLNLPTSRYITTKTDYNSAGQVISLKDPNGNQTTTSYDSYGYPITVKNALNQTLQSTYDPRNGNVLTDTDINNQLSKYSYDALGRLMTVVGPLDSDASPSVQYNYHPELLGNPATQNIEKHTKEHYTDSQFLWTKTFYDGLSRNYMSQQNDVSSQVVQTDTQFDIRGLPISKSLPHFTTDLTPQWVQTTYDALGRVTQVQTPDGKITNTVYQGRSVFVTNPNSDTQSSVADAYGRVIQRNEPSIPTPTTYSYDPLGHLTKLTDSQGKVTQFTYDSLGRKIGMVDPNAGTWSYSYNDVGNLNQQTDARGVVLSFQYDSLNRLTTRTLLADPQTQTGQSLGLLTTYVYDQVDSRRPYSLDRLTSVLDANGIVTNFFHDQLGRVTMQTKTVGTNTYSIDSQYDALSRPTQIIYPNNGQVNYVYDAAGHLSSVTDESGNVLASYPSYDAQSRPAELEQNNTLIRTYYTYDPLQQTLASLRTESWKTSLPIVLQNMNYQFDPVGNVMSIADQLDSSRNQNFTYDHLNRLTNAVGEYGNETFGYDSLGNFTKKDQIQYGYDLTATHPYAVTRTYSANTPARDSSTILAWNFDPSEPIYSVSGNVTKGSGSVPNAPIVVTGALDTAILSSSTGTYLVQGLSGNYSVAASSTGMISSPSGYAYNPLAANQSNLNFSLSTDPNPPLDMTHIRVPRTAFASGQAGNQSNGTYVGGGFVGVSLGGVWGVNGSSTNYSGYSPLPDGNDLMSEPTAQVISPPLSVAQGILGPSFVPGKYQQALKFNGTSDLFVYPNSQSLAPTAITLMMWAKPSANPSSSAWATLLAKSNGAALGQLSSGFRLVLLPSGQIMFEIGKSGGSVSLISVSSATLNQWNYINATYDGQTMKIYLNGDEDASLSTTVPLIPNGNLVASGGQIDDSRREVPNTFFQGILDEPRIQNRAWTEGDILDALDSYDAATYTYDNNGDQLTKTLGDTTWNYQFDAQRRLTQVKENGTSSAQFVYDGDGGRVQKITPAGTTLYIGNLYEERGDGSRLDHVYANGQLICDLWSSNSQTTTTTNQTSGNVQTVHSLAINPASGNPITNPITNPLTPNSQIYYYSADHLGSTALVTDSSGSLLQEIHYEPFGDIFSSEGTSPTHHKYTGQENDSETGLDFYNARYYDPTLGRFISQDSIVPSAMDPQSLNRYAYVRNNPLTYTDPSGHSWLSHEIGKVNHWADHNQIGSTLIAAICPTIGIPLMDRTNTGRELLAGMIIAGTIVAVPAGGAFEAGALSGETIGALSAYRSGGSILSGVVVGGVVGGISGYLGNNVATLNNVSISDASTGSDYSQLVLKSSERFIASGAIEKAGTGAISAYAGGTGSWRDIFRGVYQGAATGALVNATLVAVSGVAYLSGTGDVKIPEDPQSSIPPSVFKTDDGYGINESGSFQISYGIGRVRFITADVTYAGSFSPDNWSVEGSAIFSGFGSGTGILDYIHALRGN